MKEPTLNLSEIPQIRSKRVVVILQVMISFSNIFQDGFLIFIAIFMKNTCRKNVQLNIYEFEKFITQKLLNLMRSITAPTNLPYLSFDKKFNTNLH